MPALRIGDIVHAHEIFDHAVKVEGCAHHEKTLWPGKPLELDPERAARLTARAVGADQKARAFDLTAALALHGDVDATRALCDVAHRAGKDDLEVLLMPQLLEQNARQPRLLA